MGARALGGLWHRFGERDERELAASLIGAIAIAGPAVGLVTTAFPQPPGTDTAAAVSAFAVSVAIGILVLWQRATLGWTAIALAAAAGAAVITAVMLSVPDRTATYATYYVWIGIFAFYFLSPRRALLIVAWIAALYAIAVVDGDGSAPVEEWLNAVATTLGVGLLVLALRTRIAGLVGRLEQAALSDELTGVANRRAFTAQLDREVERSDRGGAPLSLALVDLDAFKELNDSGGHLDGDAALRRFAELLTGSLRAMDFPARVGGDEFALILPETGQEDALRVAERLRESAGREFAGEPGPALTVSIGVATTAPDEPADAASLYADADRSLYAAKAAGGDRVRGRAGPRAEAEVTAP